MKLLDLAAFEAQPLCREPFDYVIVPGFVRADALPRIASDFPRLAGPGSFPAGSVRPQASFAELLAELESPPVAEAFSGKFGVALAGRPTMITVRGWCDRKDGGVHTDSATKILTALLYLNEGWAADGGRLRLLRSAGDLDDYAAEVPPEAGTLIAFRRSERSWHGHFPFEGERRSVQLNWVTSRAVVRREQLRHQLSAAVKRAFPSGAARWR